jgi:hypothetical protein
VLFTHDPVAWVRVGQLFANERLSSKVGRGHRRPVALLVDPQCVALE